MLSKINVIRASDFRLAWIDALGFVVAKGIPITFGKDGKRALDSCQLIELTGDAIGQIERHEVHADFPFGGKRLDGYCKEFERDFLKEYKNRNDDAKFDYLYFERLASYNGMFDQLQVMRENLELQIADKSVSNYCQAITWIPDVDNGDLTSPCLQRVWIRYIGDMGVDVHFEFRSRDLYGAFPANLCALFSMLNREVVKPNGCQIVRVVDYSDSLHLYDTDLDAVKKIALNPMVVNH
jgi:thymidylate synthase